MEPPLYHTLGTGASTIAILRTALVSDQYFMLSYGAAGFTVSQGHWAEAARVHPIAASALPAAQ